MKRVLFAFIVMSTPAQAYKADQQALLMMSDMLATAVGAELVCGNVTASGPFFHRMEKELGMDKQDIATVSKLTEGKKAEIAEAIERNGKDTWCAHVLPIMLKKTSGLSPVEMN